MCKKHLTSVLLALGSIAVLPVYGAIDITEDEATARWVECCDVCAKSIDNKTILYNHTLQDVLSGEDSKILLDNVTSVMLTHTTTEKCLFKYTINDDADQSMFGALRGQRELEGEIELRPFYKATVNISDPKVAEQANGLCKNKSKDYICTDICKLKYTDQGNDWTCATDLTWDITIDTMVTSTLDKYAASLVQVDRSAIVPSGQMTRSVALKNGMTLALDHVENINIKAQMGAKEHGIVTVNATVLVYNFICSDSDCSCVWGMHMPPSKSYALIALFRIGDAQNFKDWTQQYKEQCVKLHCNNAQETHQFSRPVQVLMENDIFERGREARAPYAIIPLLLQFGAYRIQQSNISWSLLDPNNKATTFPRFNSVSNVSYVGNKSSLQNLVEVATTCTSSNKFSDSNNNQVYVLNDAILEDIQLNQSRSSFENSIHTMLNNRDSYPIEAIFGSERIQNMLHGTLSCKQYYYQSRSEILTANLVTVVVLFLTAVINFSAERSAGGCPKQSRWLVGDKPPTIVDIIANWAAITPVILYGFRTVQCINNDGNIGCGGHPVPVNLMVWGLKPYHPAIANELPNGRTYVGDVYLNMNCTTSSAEVEESQHKDKTLAIATVVIGGLAIIARLVHTLMCARNRKKDNSTEDTNTNEYNATYHSRINGVAETPNQANAGGQQDTNTPTTPTRRTGPIAPNTPA